MSAEASTLQCTCNFVLLVSSLQIPDREGKLLLDCTVYLDNMIVAAMWNTSMVTVIGILMGNKTRMKGLISEVHHEHTVS